MLFAVFASKFKLLKCKQVPTYFFLKMAQTWPLFVYFSSFHMTNIAQN